MSGRPVFPPTPILGPLSSRLARWCGLLLTALLLTGCAAQMAFREGKELLAQGRVEDGLGKFQEAITHAPREPEYRAAYLQARDQAVIAYIAQADRMVDASKWSDAEKLYQRVLMLDNSNDRAHAGLRAVEMGQRHARLLAEARANWEKKDADGAQHKLALILTENPRHADAQALRRTLLERPLPPSAETALSAAFRKPITIEFKDVALKQVFEVISRTSGLNFLFDKDVKTDQKTSIFLKNSTIASAVHFTLLTNQLEQQVLDGNTILIYPNTAAKQKDYQEMLVKTFYLANADAKSVANTLKTIVKSKDVVADEKLNMLIVRDSPDAIRLAEKLIALQDVPEPEVMLEVEILEIKRTRLQELGVKWPDTLTLTPLPATTGGALTLRDLTTNLNSGTISAGVGAVSLNLKQQDSDANILANPRIRARNHEKAKILIGERVPNITSTATATGFVSESINYVDVGLKLDVEPTIYLDNDVAIKVALEVSNIVSQIQTKAGSVAYQIGTRTASTVLRLKDGENQVLAGLINDEDRKSTGKVPGLGELPVVGRLFGSTADNNQKTEIVLSITPRLVRNIQRPDAILSEFRAGTDSSFRIRPDATPMVNGTSAPASPVPNRPSVTGNPTSTPSASPNPATIQSTDGTVALQDAPMTILRLQGPADAKVGETFSLQLTMQSGQPVVSLPIALSFDNRAFQVVSVTEGDFLKQGGAQTNFSSRVDPNGQILITGTRSGEGEGGATVPGTVATVNFRALASVGSARIQLLTATPVGPRGTPVAVPTAPPYTVTIKQ